METRYNVYFAGEVLAGHEPAKVRAAVGQLFKANDAMLDKLFNGRTHLVKRGCDKPTAIKYKQAMEKVGARPVIKTADPADAAAAPKAPPETPPVTPTAAPATERPQTAAERIAALAAAPDVGTEAPTAASVADTQDGVSVAPPQSDVLRPEERTPPVERSIDTGDLAVDASSEHLAEPAPPPPPAPDVNHLSMGDVGDDIPSLPSEATPLDPDTAAINLAPEGTDFSDCAAPDAPEPALDLSSIVLAPEGSDVLEEEFRRREDSAAPDTGHITLED